MCYYMIKAIAVKIQVLLLNLSCFDQKKEINLQSLTET